MSEYKLTAQRRAESGKGPARRARAAGRVPAVLYGHGMDPVHLSVDAREFGHALRTGAGSNVLIELSVGRSRPAWRLVASRVAPASITGAVARPADARSRPR